MVLEHRQGGAAGGTVRRVRMAHPEAPGRFPVMPGSGQIFIGHALTSPDLPTHIVSGSCREGTCRRGKGCSLALSNPQ